MKNSTRGKFIFTNLEFKEIPSFCSVLYIFTIPNTHKNPRDADENERREVKEKKNFPKEFCK